jgi:hypothetical protein
MTSIKIAIATSGRDPNLGLLLFVMSRLPHALNNTIDDLIHVTAFDPHILDASLVMPGCHRLLNNHRRGRNHNRSGSHDGRLCYDNS